MKSPFLIPLLALALLAGGSPLASAKSPDAETLLNAVRYSQTQNNAEIPGTLRKGRHQEALEVRMNGPVITFFFPSAPTHLISLDLQNNNYELRESLQGNPLQNVPPAHYERPIRNTDINYEDLSMAFLYWPNPVALGEDRVGERLVWKVRVVNPKQTGPYGQLVLWVDQNSGGLLKMEGFNRDGKKIKEMRVISVRKTDAGWMLRQMRVMRIDPRTGRTGTPTYLDFKDPK